MPARSRKVSSMTARTEYQAAIDARLVFWVTDPGHGWLAVPFKALRDSGVAEQVSSYSYVGSARRGYVGYALLEEDCDAGLYLQAKGVFHDNRALPEFTFDQPNCSRNVAHNVRALDRYSADTVLNEGR